MIFFSVIFKTILHSQLSELNYLYSELSMLLIQTHKSAEPQPHLVSDSQATLSQHYKHSNNFQQFSLLWLFKYSLSTSQHLPGWTLWQLKYPQALAGPKPNSRRCNTCPQNQAHKISGCSPEIMGITVPMLFQHFKQIRLPKKLSTISAHHRSGIGF